MNWRQSFVLFGVFLINVPNGVTWYYGNLFSYTACVFKQNQGSNIETPWLMSVEVACWTMGIILGGLIEPYLGLKGTMFLGSMFFNISLFLTYLTVQDTLVTFIITLGVMTGLADGVLHSASLSYIVMWVKTNVGLATGVATSSLGLGAVIINLIITGYINPDNLNPDKKDGNFRIFTQEDILDRVPRVFLVLGAFSTIFHFLGFVFLQTKESYTVMEITVPAEPLSPPFLSGSYSRSGQSSGRHEASDKTLHPCQGNSRSQSGEAIKKSSKSGKPIDCESDPETRCKKDQKCLNSTSERQQTHPSSARDTGDDVFHVHDDAAQLLPSTQQQPGAIGGGDDVADGRDPPGEDCPAPEPCHPNATGHPNATFHPMSMLRTKAFYVFLVLQFAMDYALVTVSHFYKLFGETWLKDDHSLTVLGTVMTASTLLPKLLLGALQDKLGLRETWIILTSGTTITSAFWYFTPKVSKWLFFFWTICFTWFVCAFDSLVAAGVAQVFGPFRCNLKYGVVAALSTLLQLSSPPVMSLILDTFGWHGLFLSVGALHFISLIMVVLGLPGNR